MTPQAETYLYLYRLFTKCGHKHSAEYFRQKLLKAVQGA